MMARYRFPADNDAVRRRTALAALAVALAALAGVVIGGLTP